MKNRLLLSFFVISVITISASKNCSKCVKTADCPAYGRLSQDQQSTWQNSYPCSAPDDDNYNNRLYGFSPVAKGDYVCCSKDALRNVIRPNYGGYNYPNSQNPSSSYGNNGNNGNRWGGSDSSSSSVPGQGSGSSESTEQPPKNYFHVNNSPYVTSSPFYNGNGNFGGNVNQQQCPVTSFPPKLDSGCCGREATDSDRIIVTPSQPSYYDSSPETTTGNTYDNSPWSSWNPRQSRFARSAEVSSTPVSIGNRIIGGHETTFEQFPWTVLLDITFDYGDRRQGFNCGGSLISSRYILTAGHCVYDKGGKVVDLTIYLAEYDKRTFPIDCKIIPGRGKKCIKNLLMKAEDFVLHPEYDDDQLKNDIALIRLRGHAPYTDYIRPICLPTINIDSPDFSNLRLAVAGWGRDGRYRSDIKQSTIVNLVTQAKCKKYYPNLTRRQMCAAGYTGEDTCKGDSGGPLMTVYGGKYEVVGVVSGKRADSPCGTSVPSLYTNVYHYNDWILRNIKP